MTLPGRTHSSPAYRYGFQGQEKDGETGMEAFELRLWDGRLGRWLTVDPKHEFHSPYVGMGNNPISLIDPDGGATDDPPTWKGNEGDYYYDPNDDTSYLYLDGSWQESLKEVILTRNPNSTVVSIFPDYRIASPTNQQNWFTNFFLDDRTVQHGNFRYKVDDDGFATGLAPVGGSGALGFVSGGGSINFIKYTSEAVKTLKYTEAGAQSIGGIAKYKRLLKSDDIYDSVEAIEVIVHRGVKYIADGHHRTSAAKELNKGLEVIEYSGKEAAKRFPELYKQIVNGTFK